LEEAKKTIAKQLSTSKKLQTKASHIEVKFKIIVTPLIRDKENLVLKPDVPEEIQRKEMRKDKRVGRSDITGHERSRR
jgi:hypothetical protein